MQITTTTTTTQMTQSAAAEQQLGQLFNTIHMIWNVNQTHFGHKVFDEFIKSIPTTYYYLLSFQQQQKEEKQQKQQQKPSNKPSKQSSPSSSSPQSQLAKIAKRRRKKSCIAIPKLESIDEETSSFSSQSPSPSPSPPSSSTADKLNIFATEFVPKSNESTINKIEENITNITKPKSYNKVRPFIPAHSARAKSNIYIPKYMTKKLLSSIDESFPNTGTLYYYLDISTALQINDGQIHIIQTINGEELAFINFDLHERGTGETLYAVIIANDPSKIMDGNKWLWKLSEFLTISQIKDRFDILADDLPKSSRKRDGGLYNEWMIQKNKNIDISTLNKINWSEIKQIKSSQKGKKAKKKSKNKISLNQKYLINECIASWNASPSIPIIVYGNKDINKHWIEWVKMIYISSANSYIGISWKYGEDNNEWKVGSIYLDLGDLQNKNRLIGLNYNDESHIDYDEYFNNKFNTKIAEIEWKL